MYSKGLQAWMDWMETDHSHEGLADMLHDDVTFWSPIVHSPQRGKMLTMGYLGAAGNVLGGDNFKYVRIVDGGDDAVLEFETEIDGLYVNGIDMVRWAEDGRIIDFKVMVRPLQAINKVHAMMMEALEKMKAEA